MSKTMSLNDALEYSIKFAESLGVEQIEAYSNNSKEISIGVEKNIPSIVTGTSAGVSFRVVANNNLGFGFSKTLTKERLETTIKAAIQNAKSKGSDPSFKSLPQVSNKKVQKFTADKDLKKFTADQIADEMSELIKSINDVKSLNYLQGQIFLNTNEEHLMNSNGIDIKTSFGGIGGFAAAITTKGLIPNYSYGIQGSPILKNFDFAQLAQETISQTKRAAGPKTINFNKEVPIILEPVASFGLLGGLFNLLVNQLNGRNVSRGNTPYSDQVGNQIAVENFTLIDNGIHPDKLNRSPYDGEGVPRERTVLIDKGILQTYLLDTYYGHKLGLDSNGKATRAGVMGFGSDPVKTYPGISSTTVEVESGDSSKDEMIAETKEGFMVRSLMGMHMSDQSSGRFSVTGFGWYIKNGEVQYPVQDISISGVLPEIVQKIDLISKEREPMLLADAPYMRIESIPITAKKFDMKTRFGLALLKLITFFTGKHPML